MKFLHIHNYGKMKPAWDGDVSRDLDTDYF